MRYYTQRYDDEWFTPSMVTRFRCCDCGLVHNIEFKIEDDILQMCATRNNRSTGQVRRWIRYHQPTQLDLFPKL